MTESLLIIYLSYVRNIFAVIAILSLPFVAFNTIKCMNDVPEDKTKRSELCKFYKMKGVVSLLISVAIVFVITQVVKSIVRSYVFAFLVSLPFQYKVYVNGKLTHRPEKIVSILKAMTSFRAQHSYPTKPIFIKVQANHKSLELELRRDSSIHQEYWVFFPGNKITSIDQIGQINTSVFDNY